ncbi:hypothetical protein NLJ89_g7767 [Agrocybe chaxingu]|uniref:Uncharacterized protein n=1 Tax=Agrocybe chaxingu TaxID=84603 RepID=A0A9W8K306_9AGAR|nr:hypothetical protein NLJ89_g7767 [Agrocybe chaxingu]
MNTNDDHVFAHLSTPLTSPSDPATLAVAETTFLPFEFALFASLELKLEPHLNYPRSWSPIDTHISCPSFQEPRLQFFFVSSDYEAMAAAGV